MAGAPAGNGDAYATGSAASEPAAKFSAPSAVFRLLLQFHIVYSQLLLSAARALINRAIQQH